MRGVVIGAILTCGVARAQPPPSSQPLPAAESFYADGVRFYEAGDYDRAIEAFKQAHVLRPRPSLLYNIAQAYRQRGATTCELALGYYRAYLREKPDAPDRDLVEKHISAMVECAAREPQLAESGVPVATARGGTTPASSVDHMPSARPFPTLLVGVGAGTVVVGGVLQGMARYKYASLADTCPCPRETWQTWRAVELASYGAMVAGGAIVATALIRWQLSSSADATHAQVMPTVSPTTVSIAVTGGF